MKKLLTLLIVISCTTTVIYAQRTQGKYAFHIEGGYAFSVTKNDYPNFNYQGLNISISHGSYRTENLFAGIGVAFYNYRYSQQKGIIAYGSEQSMDVDSKFIAIPLFAHGL
ncbi:MAG: hypothetical protein PHR13_11300 [Dysgonamonadaceae bacterium]|nr:hypothetical protein [Dysgonamonadaceae bacterium]MDD3901623.1 hypothetical protein [Dysgonamonadaceae bacterium]MDD4400077.1 hypothetical protein [Dysgonamonadaceae bacterium]